MILGNSMIGMVQQLEDARATGRKAIRSNVMQQKDIAAVAVPGKQESE